jgi:dimethylsulfoniopropionate demethylase
MGVKIEAKAITITKEIPMKNSEGKVLGQLRSAAFSPKFKRIVGIAMIEKDYCKQQQKFQIEINDDVFSGEICNLPIE